MENFNCKTKNTTLKSIEFTQFELTKAIYTSSLFEKVDLTPSAKLFLWALCTHFNPKNETMFPSQATVAKKLGVSDKSAERAVKELKDKGLLTYVTKRVNHYVFSPKFFELVKMSDPTRQNVGSIPRQNVGLTNNTEQKNNTSFYNKKWVKSEATGGKAIPSIEETQKYLENLEEAKKTSVNPFEYNKEDALNWLKIAPKWMIERSGLAKFLIEKYEFSPRDYEKINC